jgi:hypothetical protein
MTEGNRTKHKNMCDLIKMLPLPWLFVEKKVKLRPSEEKHPEVLEVIITKTLHI